MPNEVMEPEGREGSPCLHCSSFWHADHLNNCSDGCERFLEWRKRAMKSFDKAIDFVLDHEGGYSNDPNDPGGETKFGIAKRYHPDLDIQSLTIDQAKALYKKGYWDRLNLDDLPERVAFILFDTAVNCGTVRAVKLLQKSLNALQPESALAEDGILGPHTIRVMLNANERELVREFILQRQKYYRQKVRDAPKKSKFFAGWILRTLDLSDLVG